MADLSLSNSQYVGIGEERSLKSGATNSIYSAVRYSILTSASRPRAVTNNHRCIPPSGPHKMAIRSGTALTWVTVKDALEARPVLGECDTCSSHEWKIHAKLGEDWLTTGSTRTRDWDIFETHIKKLWISTTSGSCPTCAFIWRGLTHFIPKIEDVLTWPEECAKIRIHTHKSGKMPLHVQVKVLFEKELNRVIELYTAKG
ncbi:uncharacterized protein B0I36DRAFT_60376 [Microdochium trichocladiopsis]|uniref:Uncharacterized protein n=1 Tax=Microdochium trichocladiopsis TaxID=1682393 RepID=A0A9P9BEU8_9PEZI|nr:uncharacterized protein B0I36DRAFT_60376 [Microdochium trichocladiopsis]KAH7009205.1 hypothetical protein B0I36DRAFT_60376 [Microdochium trichocladiopsis]